MTWQVIEGDCLPAMAELEDASVDAVITDPPYCSAGVSEKERTTRAGQGLRS